jgi:hypothetical protein
MRYMNGMCGFLIESSVLYQRLFALQAVKYPHQATTGSGLENQQGRLDSDFRPGVEEFRASSS